MTLETVSFEQPTIIYRDGHAVAFANGAAASEERYQQDDDTQHHQGDGHLLGLYGICQIVY